MWLDADITTAFSHFTARFLTKFGVEAYGGDEHLIFHMTDPLPMKRVVSDCFDGLTYKLVPSLLQLFFIVAACY
jgi:hypothetical protein